MWAIIAYRKEQKSVKMWGSIYKIKEKEKLNSEGKKVSINIVIDVIIENTKIRITKKEKNSKQKLHQ